MRHFGERLRGCFFLRISDFVKREAENWNFRTWHPEASSPDQTALLLDVGATAAGQAHLITDGLAGQVVPALAWHSKTQREATFPIEILRHGLFVDICNASATRPVDKTRILGSIALPRQQTALLSAAESDRYREVNQGLASHFALASWYGHLDRRQPLHDVAAALAADGFRRIVPLAFSGFLTFLPLATSPLAFPIATNH